MLAGSATPGLSIEDLINLSSERAVTAQNLSFQTVKLSSGLPQGGEELRKTIAAFFKPNITASHVHTANGTTGANSLVFQSLLKPGDHVIAMYPSYAQLIAMPRAITGVEMSFWYLNLEDQARVTIQALEALIKPSTTMIVLNNPNNPTGTLITPDLQDGIVALARLHDITIVVDEIFRPLFHDTTTSPAPSFLDIPDPYDKIVVTGSLSKAWGLSGVRAGWLATRNLKFIDKFYDTGLYTTQSLSRLDEIVATEALSDRCRPQILSKHLEFAQQSLNLLQGFIEEHKNQCSWTRPNAGATAFVKFSANGVPVDEVDFCLKLKQKFGVLASPGGLCFGTPGTDDLRGYVRIHITVPPKIMQAAIEALKEFIRE